MNSTRTPLLRFQRFTACSIRPLEQWDIAIYYGIKTGYNAAFIIDNDTKNALVVEDPSSAEIIRPILRGKNIQRYQVQSTSLWLIDSHNGFRDVPAINVANYTAIREHLDRFYSKLEKRKDKGITPYNLRNCAYHDDFSKKKLVWITLSNYGRFAYDESGLFCEANTFMMTGHDIKYLCAMLNTNLIRWYLQQIAPTSGLGTLLWKKIYVEAIPIPRITAAKQRAFNRIVDRILSAKAVDPKANTIEKEAEIDQLAYALYGLTEEETESIIAVDNP